MNDVKNISYEIDKAVRLLNVRELLAEVIIRSEGYDCKRSAEQISELLTLAEETLEKMKDLQDSLQILRSELFETFAIAARYTA